MSFELILPDILEHFQTCSAKERLRLFIAKDRQVEGWFKGELMLVFDASTQVAASCWEPEVTYNHGNGRSKCDFVLKPRKNCKRLIGVEIKTARPGWQHKRTLDRMAKCRSDFDKGSSPLTSIISGLVADAKKLRETDLLKERVCLLFAYGESQQVWRYGGQPLPRAELLGQFREGLQGRMADNWTVVPTRGADPPAIDLGDEKLLQILSYQVEEV